MINKYSLKVNAFLNKYGDEIINKIIVIRVPITSFFNSIIKPFNNINYDKYFHLSLIINDKYIIEKNEIINFNWFNKIRINNDGSKSPPDYSKIQHYNINSNIIPKISIKKLLYNTQQYMGSAYFTYAGLTNNCQDFILSILKSNNIYDEQLFKFIKQDTQYIKKNWPTLKNIMNFSTNIAGIFSTNI
jgi:hypothetical protein